MYPVPFDYLEPKSLEEAVELLRKHGESARILAGGQSLIPLMKLRLARPKYLIDLNRVPGLNTIKEQDGCVLIGALARHVEIEESKIIRERVPIMREAAAVIGDQQVRNLGTIGGALVEADPAGDWGPVMLALNARIKCVGPSGERQVEAKDFFTFAYTTALQTDEAIAEIAIPIPKSPASGAYLKLERVAGDFSIVSVAIQLDLDERGVCRDIGIGLGGADDRPVKAEPAEALLRGQRITLETLKNAARAVQEMANPIGDLQGSPEYKKEVLKVIFRRALQRLIGLNPH